VAEGTVLGLALVAAILVGLAAIRIYIEWDQHTPTPRRHS
jgi:hypothetical protein